ncbi:Maf-like protein [Pararhizobium mangrovi]|uniref:7-methyl-GTP pyrophosphatase n=1 Tax=Pararhizobium mangrovi TaxID=2590452 RepID=A0A506U2K0_9HYPH|nr:Maf-like protein [Pararhizobium mangrovi]TPW27264.1 Maf-like protein [Pararhizobium mangrovi]
MASPIILASQSPFRRSLLENAGVDFEAIGAQIDERAVEAPLADTGLGPEDVASVLAEAKAVDVSQRRPDAIVIGADQTLSLGDEIFHKPADMEAARAHLLALSGRSHALNSALVIARGGAVEWRHSQVATMRMRVLDPGFIGRYLSATGEVALQSVGAYQYEGRGIQLFERVEGDYFAIVGLPMLPLLAKLRDMGAIDG